MNNTLILNNLQSIKQIIMITSSITKQKLMMTSSRSSLPKTNGSRMRELRSTAEWRTRGRFRMRNGETTATAVVVVWWRCRRGPPCVCVCVFSVWGFESSELTEDFEGVGLQWGCVTVFYSVQVEVCDWWSGGSLDTWKVGIGCDTWISNKFGVNCTRWPMVCIGWWFHKVVN